MLGYLMLGVYIISIIEKPQTIQLSFWIVFVFWRGWVLGLNGAISRESNFSNCLARGD
jgi:hypothetical protein